MHKRWKFNISCKEQTGNLWQLRDFSSACWMLPVTLTVSPDLGSSVFTFDFEHECDAHYEVPVKWPILSSLPPAPLPRVITSLCLLRGWPALLWPEPAYRNSFQRNKAQQCTERQVLGRTAWYKWMYPDLCHVCSGKNKTKPRQLAW